MTESTIESPPTTERITLADVAQDVVDSARYETECYVTVNRIDGLEACIPDALAIEAATRELLTASRELVDCYRNVPYPPTAVLTLKAAADALETLIGVPS